MTEDHLIVAGSIALSGAAAGLTLWFAHTLLQSYRVAAAGFLSAVVGGFGVGGGCSNDPPLPPASDPNTPPPLPEYSSHTPENARPLLSADYAKRVEVWERTRKDQVVVAATPVERRRSPIPRWTWPGFALMLAAGVFAFCADVGRRWYDWCNGR